MPATASTSVSYVMSCATINFASKTAVVSFSRVVGGQAIDTVNYQMQSADILPIMGAMPSVGLSRHDDITTAIYNAAVAAGVIAGTVTVDA